MFNIADIAVFCFLMLLVLRIGKQADVTTPLLMWATAYPGSVVSSYLYYIKTSFRRETVVTIVTVVPW